MSKNIFYHGTRTEYLVGDTILPSIPYEDERQDQIVDCLYLTQNLDEAIWDAELADGDGFERVYTVEPTGPLEIGSDQKKQNERRHPTMSLRSFYALKITGEVTEWLLYHGTRADLKLGDMIEAGYISNFGKKKRKANYVYMCRTLDAAIWGAELAAGEGSQRIFIVEPTGPYENDPNLTNMKFRGNPTKSFRSRMPLRIVGEIGDWQGHPAEAVQAMKERIKKLEDDGIEADD